MDETGKKREYREMKLDSVKAVRAHNGSRQSFETLIQVLAKFEKWIGENFENGANRASDETEELVAMEYSNSKLLTINDLLMQASRRVERLVKGELSPQQIAENLHIKYIEIDQPFLPSNGEGGMLIKAEGKEKYRPPKYIPKLQMLLGLLQRLEIFTEDIVITSGINIDNMMRRESYALVEFINTGKEILICNESGQATYASHLPYGKDAYQELSKKEIIKQLGVTKINYLNPEQWTNSIREFLNAGKVELIVYENTLELKKKLRTKENLDYINSLVGPEARAQYRFNNLDLRQIAKILGLRGDPINDMAAYSVLFLEIFGNGAPKEAKAKRVLPKRFFTWEDELPTDVEYYLGIALEDSELNDPDMFSSSMATHIQACRKLKANGGDAGT